MSTKQTKAPAAYTKLQEKKRREMEVASEENSRLGNILRAEEDTLMKRLRKAIRPYNKSVIEGHKITVADHKDNCVLNVDGHKWLTFKAARSYGHCACENVCDCETTTWLSLDVIQHRTRSGYENYRPWFPCGEDSLGNEEEFAEALMQMMEDYKWRND